MAKRRTPFLSPTPFEHEKLCFGFNWIVSNRRKIAKFVARLLLGQHRHVLKVLNEVDSTPPNLTEVMVSQTIKKLRPSSQKQAEHRDGWLFQVIAWIATVATHKDGVVVSAPHSRQSDKGFDALIIELDAGRTSATHITVSEEKATTKPRNLFQQQVLPEFRDLERGLRDTELLSEITTLLESADLDAVDKSLDEVLWQNERRYRACLTVEEKHTDSSGRIRLLKDYDSIVDGHLTRRRAELFLIPDLRTWMNDFSEEVVAELERLRR